MLFDIYKNKSVLITGNTGFKGSWLTIWLRFLGADVTGFSSEVPTVPSNYDSCALDFVSKTRFADVRDLVSLKSVVEETQPDYIFHLAAQSLVKKSYDSPIDTFTTNAIGSANILEASRVLTKPVSIVMITSDKAYDNVEWKWGYRENDVLGGKDPYSASKGMAELVIRSYFTSFMNKENCNQKIGITRAGNVIGGGDWALDRIIPDCVKSWSRNEVVEVRNPEATRPWQHVLEPLSGYLTLGAQLGTIDSLNGEAYNFGPASDQNYSVSQLINEMKKYWTNVSWLNTTNDRDMRNEAGLLKLNCDKALFDLKWNPALNFEETVKFTVDWYKAFYDQSDKSMYDFCVQQIEEYTKIAHDKKIWWAIND
jgi:CDP-glucose 4,6-dehydratase